MPSPVGQHTQDHHIKGAPQNGTSSVPWASIMSRAAGQETYRPRPDLWPQHPASPPTPAAQSPCSSSSARTCLNIGRAFLRSPAAGLRSPAPRPRPWRFLPAPLLACPSLSGSGSQPPALRAPRSLFLPPRPRSLGCVFAAGSSLHPESAPRPPARAWVRGPCIPLPSRPPGPALPPPVPHCRTAGAQCIAPAPSIGGPPPGEIKPPAPPPPVPLAETSAPGKDARSGCPASPQLSAEGPLPGDRSWGREGPARRPASCAATLGDTRPPQRDPHGWTPRAAGRWVPAALVYAAAATVSWAARPPCCPAAVTLGP